MPESTLTVNRWTPTRKAAVILELLRGGEAGELARTHGLSQAQLFVRRDRRVRELERRVGQLTLEKALRKTTDALIRHRGRRSTG